jgi:glycosyltransferase involved in cell wall biosynthesis
VRIGINALFLIPGGVGGTEIYVRSLLQAMSQLPAGEHEYFIFMNRESEALPLIEAPGFHAVACGVRARNRPQRIVWEQAGFLSLLRRHRIDVLFNPGFTMPLLFRRPSVTVFHDLQHRRHPRYFYWLDLPFWKLLLRASAMRSHSLVAVSESTARDLARYYPQAAHKTVVIHHGVDTEFFRIGKLRGADRDKYLLTVSTLHPHKNIARLMEAFHVFHAARPDYRLIVAGLKGRAAASLEARRDQLGLHAAIIFTGWIPREELYELFKHADAFIAPSRFEGFGMPILEALAAGIPSACSAISPLSEIAGSAAAQFDPESVPAIVSAMERITTDCMFRERAAIDGPQRARQFDWNHTAKLTLREIEKAAGCP